MSATWKRDTSGLTRHAQQRGQDARKRVDQAITTLGRDNKPINFHAVSIAASVTKSYLYTQPDIRQRIEALRQQQSASHKRPTPARLRSHAGQDLVIAAKDRRIRVLEEEVRQLKRELQVANGKLYDTL